MLRILAISLSVILILALFVFIGLWLLAKQSKNEIPSRLSKQDLIGERETPNYVSSLSENPERKIAPLHFDGDPFQAWNHIRTAAREIPNSQFRTENANYLHLECRTPLLGFVDDLELLLKPEDKIIHVRSGSRVGKSDMGANAKRVEKLRMRFRSLSKE